MGPGCYVLDRAFSYSEQGKWLLCSELLMAVKALLFVLSSVANALSLQGLGGAGKREFFWGHSPQDLSLSSLCLHRTRDFKSTYGSIRPRAPIAKHKLLLSSRLMEGKQLRCP